MEHGDVSPGRSEDQTHGSATMHRRCVSFELFCIDRYRRLSPEGIKGKAKRANDRHVHCMYRHVRKCSACPLVYVLNRGFKWCKTSTSPRPRSPYATKRKVTRMPSRVLVRGCTVRIPVRRNLSKYSRSTMLHSLRLSTSPCLVAIPTTSTSQAMTLTTRSKTLI